MPPSPTTGHGDAPLSLPRVTDVDLDRAVEGVSWPPVPTARLEFRQSWLPELEPAFRPANVGLAATDQSLLIFAELTDEHITTQVTADHERIWERGDVFEIFLQLEGTEPYFEFQISPNGHRLQMHYPRAGSIRANGFEPYIRRDKMLDFALRLEPAKRYWRIAVRIPVTALLPANPRHDGVAWRAAFCRYDYDAEGKFCLSSTAGLTQLGFHRMAEWSHVHIPGGFSPREPAA